jgi:hypothetical protein
MFVRLNLREATHLDVESIILRYPVSGEWVAKLPENIEDGRGQQFTVAFFDLASDIIGYDFIPQLDGDYHYAAHIGSITRKLSDILAEDGWWCQNC